MNSRELKILATAAEREDIYLFKYFPEYMSDTLEALEIELEDTDCGDDLLGV